jgi:tight adherence protein B
MISPLVAKRLRSAAESFRQRRRMRELPLALAQDLELIANALRAGASFVQALQVAAKESDGPLTEEWNNVLKDQRMGANLDQALNKLQARLPVPAIGSMASVASIIQETGGNLAGALLTLSGTLRQEIAFQGKLRAMTAQGRMSGWVVSAMPFFLMAILSLMSPDLMSPLFTTPLGWGLLGAVVVMVSIGGFVIKKIVTIEV